MNTNKNSRRISTWKTITVLNDNCNTEFVHKLDSYGRLENKFPRAKKGTNLMSYLEDDDVINEQKYIPSNGYSINDILNDDKKNDNVKNNHNYGINDILNRPKIPNIDDIITL